MLDHCAFYYDGKTIRKMTKRDKDKIMESVDNLASQAMRNLAIAYKPIEPPEGTYTMENVEN